MFHFDENRSFFEGIEKWYYFNLTKLKHSTRFDSILLLKHTVKLHLSASGHNAISDIMWCVIGLRILLFKGNSVNWIQIYRDAPFSRWHFMDIIGRVITESQSIFILEIAHFKTSLDGVYSVQYRYSRFEFLVTHGPAMRMAGSGWVVDRWWEPGIGW